MRGAIFDLDGTLLDSMHVWDNIGANYLATRGIEAPENIWDILKEMSLYQAAEYFQTEYHLPFSVDEIMEQINTLVEDQYRYQVGLKPYVWEFLRSLQQSGVKMCVATATDRKPAEAALKRLGVLEFFDFILTCTEAGVGKDVPDIFLAACEKLGTPNEETFVFEDALYAIRSAKAAGFYVVALADDSAKADQEEIAKTADVYLKSFQEFEVSI